jgi:hypothetical protein
MGSGTPIGARIDRHRAPDLAPARSHGLSRSTKSHHDDSPRIHLRLPAPAPSSRSFCRELQWARQLLTDNSQALRAREPQECFQLNPQLRVWNAVLSHCLFSKPSIPPNLAPLSLFLLVITESYVQRLESDYNLHKSNATNFFDLDVARLQIVRMLLEPGIVALRNNNRHKIVFDHAGGTS